jgi:hypothetical protein
MSFISRAPRGSRGAAPGGREGIGDSIPTAKRRPGGTARRAGCRGAGPTRNRPQALSSRTPSSQTPFGETSPTGSAATRAGGHADSFEHEPSTNAAGDRDPPAPTRSPGIEDAGRDVRAGNADADGPRGRSRPPTWETPRTRPARTSLGPASRRPRATSCRAVVEHPDPRTRPGIDLETSRLGHPDAPGAGSRPLLPSAPEGWRGRRVEQSMGPNGRLGGGNPVVAADRSAHPRPGCPRRRPRSVPCVHEGSLPDAGDVARRNP